MEILVNIASLVLVVLSVALSVALFVSLKKEIHGSAVRCEQDNAKLRLRVEALMKRTDELEQELSEAAMPGMTVSKRSQAVRRMRRGEGPEQIASALDLPLTEVALLIKVEERFSRLTS